MICYLRDGKKVVRRINYGRNTLPSRFIEILDKKGNRVAYEMSDVTMNKERTKVKSYYYKKVKSKKLLVS